MGGLGSGRWFRFETKKSTVEESLSLAVKDLRGRLFGGASGTFSWRWAGGRMASIGYFITWSAESPLVNLQYRCGDEQIEIPVRMQTTTPAFGGCRWWFTCPLITRGVPCGRRVGKLYSPPRSRYFGCRICHGLTYRSSQEAHQEERLTGSIEGLGKYLDALKLREGIE